MVKRAKTHDKARRFVERLRAPLEPRHSTAIGTVASVTRNAAGQVQTVNVALSNGTTITDLNGAGWHGLGTGAKVRLDGTGGKTATNWAVAEIIAQAVGTSGTDISEIVSTPVHAFIETTALNALRGGRAVSTEFGFYLIAEQWRYAQPVRYDVEVRDATTLASAYRVSTDAARRVAGALRTGVDDNDTAIEVEDSGQTPPTPYVAFDGSNGIALVEDELIRYASITYDSTYLTLNNATRGYASTTPAAHSAGAEVTWRGLSVPIPALEPNTAYEVRVRAINATNGNASNWSNWESFTTANNGQVPPNEPRGTNALANGTFDANVNNWTLSTISATKNHDTSVYFAGGGSMRIDDSRSGAMQLTNETRSDAFTVAAASEFYFRVMVRQSGYSDADDEIAIIVLEAGTANRLGRAVYVGTKITTAASQWDAVTIHGYIPTGVTSVEVLFSTTIDSGAGATSVWFDEAYFVQQATLRGASVGRLQVGGGAIMAARLRGAASLNFGAINNGTSAELTITVTGAASGDAVTATPASGIEAGLSWSAYVSAADTVTVRLFYILTGGAAALNPAARDWVAVVEKYE